jgi:hypothetical protein
LPLRGAKADGVYRMKEEKIIDDIKSAFSRIPGNRGGLPKYRAIQKRIKAGKEISDGELRWLDDFERSRGWKK